MLRERTTRRTQGQCAARCIGKPHARVLLNAANSQTKCGHEESLSRVGCRLPWFALLIVTGGTLVSCDAPVSVSPALKGTYWQNALVTNPNRGGFHVVR
jgi:hypothetical protein